MNFGDSCHKTVEMPDYFRLFGPKRAPLSRNRVKEGFKVFLIFQPPDANFYLNLYENRKDS